MKKTLCANCGKVLREFRVTVHDDDKRMPSGDFCPSEVGATTSCYMQAYTAAAAANAATRRQIDDAATLMRGQL
jgi:hypothetical protein